MACGYRERAGVDLSDIYVWRMVLLLGQRRRPAFGENLVFVALLRRTWPGLMEQGKVITPLPTPNITYCHNRSRASVGRVLGRTDSCWPGAGEASSALRDASGLGRPGSVDVRLNTIFPGNGRRNGVCLVMNGSRFFSYWLVCVNSERPSNIASAHIGLLCNLIGCFAIWIRLRLIVFIVRTRH